MRRQLGERGKTKLYDTEKSQEVARSGEHVLYRKRSGEFFSLDSMTIRPLTLDEAKEWADHYLNKEEKARIFSVESGKKKLVSFTIDAAVHEKIKRQAAQRRIPAGQVIEELVNEKWDT